MSDVNAIDVRADLAAFPWSDLDPLNPRVALVERVGIVPPQREGDIHVVMLAFRDEHGYVVVPISLAATVDIINHLCQALPSTWDGGRR